MSRSGQEKDGGEGPLKGSAKEGNTTYKGQKTRMCAHGA